MPAMVVSVVQSNMELRLPLTMPPARSMIEASASTPVMIRPGMAEMNTAARPMRDVRRPNAPAKAQKAVVEGVAPHLCH